MKRLSVRLSIVGAVLALGGAAIAYSVLSKSGDTSSNEGEQSVAKGEDLSPQVPAPIHTDGDQSTEPTRALQPPPSSAFERPNALRTISHESVPLGNDVDDSQDATKSADIIPTADPAAESSTYNTSFPIAAPSYGSVAGSPAESTGTSTGDVTPRANSAAPAAPTYGSSYATPEGEGTAADGSSDHDLADARSGVAPPTSGFPTGSVAGEGTIAAGSGSRLGPPSSGFAADASATNASPPSTTVRTGSTFGLPDGAANVAENQAADAVATQRAPAQSSASGNGVRSDASPAAGLATGAAIGAAAAGLTGSQLGVPSRTATGAEPSASALGGPLPGTTTPPRASYPSTDTTNPSDPPTTTYDQPITNPYGNTSPGATGGYAAGTPATSYPSTNSAGPSTSPYGARAGLANATSDAGSAPLLASDMPGDPQLEGQQTPAILLEKLAPEEIQVERKATFQVRVRNAGNAVAHNVVVVDRVPRGTQFIDAVPPVTPTADGTLVWQLETVKPGEEVVLSMNLMPKVAGEIGSVAQATFQAQASVRTICTKPELKLDATFPPEILIGQPATLEITVTNTGNGAAEKVVIEEDVPEGFTHAAGRQLEHEIGTLRPQESRRLTLILETTQPGSYENHLSVRGEGSLFDEDVRKIEITSPQLQIAMQGPTLRYLDRQATYAVHLANPGTAPARNVELVTYLPKGMKYVTSDNQGQYDSQSHAVYWSLEELPADKQGDVHFTILPIEPGNHKLKTDGRADLGLNQVCEHEVAVEGLAELAFTVSDVADPIEVGSDTAYEIRVQNKGSKPDTDIQLVADLPEGITPSTGDGPTQGTVQGQRVFFAALARLGPNEEAIYKIHARGAVTGDHVIRVQVRSAELRVPVTKEEITRVYSDK